MPSNGLLSSLGGRPRTTNPYAVADFIWRAEDSTNSSGVTMSLPAFVGGVGATAGISNQGGAGLGVKGASVNMNGQVTCASNSGTGTCVFTKTSF
mgnify:CR=1 FL=1